MTSTHDAGTDIRCRVERQPRRPIVLGRGRTLFETVDARVPLLLRKTKAFRNGNIVLWYELA